MAYELFDELSTCCLEEIQKEDLEKIVEDCQRELTRRDRAEKFEAIQNFKEALRKLEYLGVCVSYDVSDFDCDLTHVPIYDGDNFTFD